MPKQKSVFKNICFEMFARPPVVSTKTVMEPLRKSYETLSAANHVISETFSTGQNSSLYLLFGPENIMHFILIDHFQQPFSNSISNKMKL